MQCGKLLNQPYSRAWSTYVQAGPSIVVYAAQDRAPHTRTPKCTQHNTSRSNYFWRCTPWAFFIPASLQCLISFMASAILPAAWGVPNV